MSNIGKNISSRRKNLCITQEQLAEKLNVTRQAVSNWENGKTEPDIETLTKIAQIFDISIDELVDGIPKDIKELRGKSIHLKLGILFSAFYVISSLILVAISEPLHEYVASTYDTFVYFLVGFVIKPLTVISGGIGISSLIAYGTGFYVKNNIIRIFFIILGIISFLLTTAYLIYVSFAYRLALPFIFSPFYYTYILEYPFLHIIAPILIFFGIAEK